MVNQPWRKEQTSDRWKNSEYLVFNKFMLDTQMTDAIRYDNITVAGNNLENHEQRFQKI